MGARGTVGLCSGRGSPPSFPPQLFYLVVETRVCRGGQLPGSTVHRHWGRQMPEGAAARVEWGPPGTQGFISHLAEGISES